MKYHYQVYRPVVLPGIRDWCAEQGLRMSDKEILESVRAELALGGSRALHQTEEERARSLTKYLGVSDELGWDQRREVVFLEEGMVGLLSTMGVEDMTVVELGLPERPIAVSWHPADRVNGLQLPPVLMGGHHMDMELGGFFADGGDGRMPKGMSISMSGGTGWVPDWVTLKKADAEEGEAGRWSGQVRDILRLCFKLLAYMRTFPQLVTSGLPWDIKPRAARYAGEIRPLVLNLHPRAKGSPNAHFRRGHFCCLRDERYKRNPDGSCKILFIEPTTVGRLEPKVGRRAVS